MQEIIRDCPRAEELVTYLYGEAAPRAAEDFRAHAERCASCRTEMAAFTGVREAVGEWRDLSLGSLAAPAAVVTPVRRRSALAALREFFTLSPIWVRAGFAAAAVIFCALSYVAFAYFTRQPEVVVLEPPGYNGVKPLPSQAAVVPESTPPSVQGTEAIVNYTPERPAPVARRRTKQERQQQLAKRKQPRQRVAAEPSLELASADDYLPFTNSGSEDKLPTLSDLVNEEN